MSREYSENVLVQNSAGNLLQNVLGWEVVLAYNSLIFVITPNPVLSDHIVLHLYGQ